MVVQTIYARYVSKQKLNDLLIRLFGPNRCTIEVTNTYGALIQF